MRTDPRPQATTGPAGRLRLADPIATQPEAPARPVERRKSADAAVKSAPPIEPLLGIDGLATVLNTSRRAIERLRSAGKLPRPDLVIGRMPRWRPQTIRDWIERGGRP